MESNRRDSENHEARVKASPDMHVIRNVVVVVGNKAENVKIRTSRLERRRTWIGNGRRIGIYRSGNM